MKVYGGGDMPPCTLRLIPDGSSQLYVPGSLTLGNVAGCAPGPIQVTEKEKILLPVMNCAKNPRSQPQPIHYNE